MTEEEISAAIAGVLTSYGSRHGNLGFGDNPENMAELQGELVTALAAAATAPVRAEDSDRTDRPHHGKHAKS